MAETNEEKQAVRDEQVRRAYRACFNSPAGQTVLTDLLPFCRVAAIAPMGGGPIDVPATFMSIGRNDVVDRIQKFARLSDEDLIEIGMLKRIHPKLGDSE